MSVEISVESQRSLLDIAMSVFSNSANNEHKNNNQRQKQHARRMLLAETLESRWLMTASLGLPASDGLWTPAEPLDATRVPEVRATEYELFSLSEYALREQLSKAPLEFTQEATKSNVVISLPRPDGSLERFVVFVSPIMAADLAEQFPEIRTFAGQGVDNPAAKIRFDITPAGFHGQVLSPDGAYYVDPYYHLDTSLYASYYATGNFRVPEARDLAKPAGDLSNDVVGSFGNSGLSGEGPATNGSSQSRTGTELRIYRTAVAASGEYTAFHGGSVGAGQAAVVTAINRVSGIYESELSIRLQLVGNNSSIIYTNAATDPYSNNNPGALLTENQANLDAVIGSANYDLGHVFTTGGGGVAGLGVVGINGRKAQGETGLPTPINDAFYVDYVAHEMGHQFGGNHTFNSSVSSCGGGNRNASTAYEPGSGSTIQAYAGICGSDDLQPNSDPYFHSISFDEILRHVDTVVPSVGSRIQTGNNVPTVSGGADYTIPARTPFMLTASGLDADADDRLTYGWEQRDLGPSTTVTAPDNGSSPLFRAVIPTASPTRFFPRLSSVINQTTSIGEITPTTNRALNFRVTVRDNRAGGSGVNTDDVRLNVVDTGSSFRVTAPNTAVSWDGLTSKPVTWDVAGTNAGSINSTTVSIYLSVDGGLSFPTLVLAGTPNDGAENIIVPNFGTSRARLMVRGDNNVFFNVNTASFTIIPTPIDINLGVGPALYVENAAPLIVSPNATVVDLFNTSYAGLSMTASIISNVEASDNLSLLSVGNGPGQISITPTRVRFGGVDIGSWTRSPNLITVNFNSASTPASLQALIRQVAYASTSESPSTLLRSFQVSMGVGLSATRAIQVTAVNDSPSLVDVTLPVVDEDAVQPVGRPVDLLFSNSFSDPDAGAQFSGIAVVANALDAAQGVWYFSGDGGTWTPVGTVDDTSKSLLLSPTSWLGFKPAPNYFGSPNPLLVRTLDDTFKGTFTIPGGTLRYLDPAAKVTDGPVSVNTGKVQLRVRNINDAPTATLPSVLINATQDQPVDWTFPSDLFVDIDSTTLTWSITPTGVPTIASWINFDPVKHTLKGVPRNADVGEFEYQLRAADSSDASVAIPLKISVANVNDPPEQLALRGQTVAENNPGVKIGAVSVLDPDGKDTITYAISDSRFIIRDGILYLQSSSIIDYESEPRVSITITATDSGTPNRSTSSPFVIEVQDANEFFPDLNPARYLIPFNRADNQLLGTVTARDADIFQTVKYRIQEDDAGIFEVGETSGQVRLKPGAQITSPSYRVFISAYDDGSPSNSRVVLFNVDVEVPNQFAPQIVPGQRFSVAENSLPGTVVGRVLAQDQDGDTNLRFSVGSGPFIINATTGIVSVATGANLNFEALASYLVPIQVTDSGSPSRSGSLPITVNLTNVNDPPTAIALANPSALSQQKGLSLSRINITDEDPATQYVFATTDPRFEFRSGILSLIPSVFFASNLVGTSTTVDVTVTDAFDSASSKVLPLKVNIVANAAPWQNRVNRLDVDRNGVVSAIDALIVINAINDKTANLPRGNLRVPRELADLALFDVDTSGDNVLSPLDAALVINALNSGSGEGESRTVESVKPQLWLDAFTSLEQERKRRGV